MPRWEPGLTGLLRLFLGDLGVEKRDHLGRQVMAVHARGTHAVPLHLYDRVGKNHVGKGYTVSGVFVAPSRTPINAGERVDT